MSRKPVGAFVSALVLLAMACSDYPDQPSPPPPPSGPVAAVTVTPDAPRIVAGTTIQLYATATDARGITVSGRAITWTSSAEAVATVSATGLVTGVSAGGPVTITASSDGHSGAALVTVTDIVTQSISLRLASTSGSVWQGNGAMVKATLIRAGGFTDSVDVTVTGGPAGVTATVYNTYTSTGVTPDYLVYISVDSATLPGDYALVVHATGGWVREATATFLLRIVVPDFILTVSSPELSITAGAAPQFMTVNVVRASFTGPVTLYVYGQQEDDGVLPAGVTAGFSVNPATGDSSVLTVSVNSATLPGVYHIGVHGETPTGWFVQPLTLTVTAP